MIVITRLIWAMGALSMLSAALPSAALASAPSAETFNIRVTGATTATVNGAVDPGGQSTTYQVEYDLAGSSWCMSGGGSGSPGSTTPPQTLAADLGFRDVSVSLSALTPGSDYCADLVAMNSSSTADGGQVTFGAGLPTVFSDGESPTGATTAIVIATVNPAGQTTTYELEYDVASSTWCTSSGTSGSPANATAPRTLPFTDATDHEVSIPVGGLISGTDYCAEIVAMNSSGSANSGQGDVFFDAGPDVSPGNVTATGGTTVTVAGSVNPVGQTTTYQVQYDLESSTWCTSDESSGAPANSTPPQTLPFTDPSDHDVAVVLSGLNPATPYCAVLVATNSSGTGNALYDFTTPPDAPAVTTGGTSAIGQTAVTVTGTVDPDGLPTTSHFDYGGTANYGASTAAAGVGAGTTPAHVATTIGGLSPGRTYHYRVVATNSHGTTNGTDQTFTTSPAPASPAPSPTPPHVTLALTGVSLGSASFTARAGTTLRFELTEPALITIVITMISHGRSVHGACKPAAKHGKRCTLARRKASLTLAGIAGKNAQHLGVTSLQTGRYTATVSARDTAGNQSRPVILAFTITKPRRAK